MIEIFRRAWRAFEAVVLWRARRKRDEVVWRSPLLAERIFRAANRVATIPWRGEAQPLPKPFNIGSIRLDVVSELATYTGLPKASVERELRFRHETSFRSEWYATPPELRTDHWFYLSSKGYLFGNAVHFPDTLFNERFVLPYVPRNGHVLDFGAGTGNLAIILAACGLNVHATELSALQRDFIRFRVAKHKLESLITVGDWWERLPASTFDAVIAVDVLEHLPECRRVLDEQLLPTLAPSGVLVENSPFVVNTSNPMHHEDFGLMQFLLERSFTLVEDGGENTRIWRRP
jgi:2-polyprenyl-3-methyl-5-hydroxy-6-metoxy-1,4-benzoquinol methylase